MGFASVLMKPNASIQKKNERPKAKCWNCGKRGYGLSTCKHCGEFISMTLILNLLVTNANRKP